jgi:hypothetical protein
MFAKKIALGFGIAVVFPMMIHYGVSSFVPRPKWQDYQMNGRPAPHVFAAQTPQYKAAEKRFQQHLFAVAVPLGLVALLVGAFLRLPAIGTGLMFGGIFSICDGYFNYWSELADVLKFVSLLVAFVLLVFLGYRRLERKEI